MKLTTGKVYTLTIVATAEILQLIYDFSQHYFKTYISRELQFTVSMSYSEESVLKCSSGISTLLQTRSEIYST